VKVKEAREPFVPESFALPVLLDELLFWLHVPDHVTAGLVSSTRFAPGVGEGVGDGDVVVPPVDPVPGVPEDEDPELALNKSTMNVSILLPHPKPPISAPSVPSQ